MKPFFRCLAFPAAILVVLTGLAVAARFLVVEDSLERADLCVALAGAERRTHHAVRLYHDGLCDRLTFIGGQARDGSLAASRKALAVAANVPADAVIALTGRVYSTYDEIARLKAFLDAEPSLQPARVTLISDPYHMRRARMVFGWIFDGSAASPERRLQMAPVPGDPAARGWLWWTDPASRSMVGREYVKLVYYWLRYRLPLPPVNDWLARFEKAW